MLCMLHVDQNEKLPLHTFLPSPAEVLLLLFSTSVVVFMLMAVTVMATVTMLCQVALTGVVAAAMVIIMDVPLLFLLVPAVISIKRVVGGVRLWICGSLGDKMLVWFVRNRICRSLLVTSLLCLGMSQTLVEDVRLVTGGRCEVLSLGEAEGHRSQEVVRMLSSDQTWLQAKQTV